MKTASNFILQGSVFTSIKGSRWVQSSVLTVTMRVSDDLC